MKTDKTTAQQLLPVHTRCPEEYMFLGVQMKILLSAKETGGQFSLIEGVMPPGGDGGLHLHANEDESMHLLEGELEVTIGDKKFPSYFRRKLLRSEEYPAPPPKPEPNTCAFSSADDPRRFRCIHFTGWSSADGQNHAAGRTSDARSNAET